VDTHTINHNEPAQDSKYKGIIYGEQITTAGDTDQAMKTR